MVRPSPARRACIRSSRDDSWHSMYLTISFPSTAALCSPTFGVLVDSLSPRVRASTATAAFGSRSTSGTMPTAWNPSVSAKTNVPPAGLGRNAGNVRDLERLRSVVVNLADSTPARTEPFRQPPAGHDGPTPRGSVAALGGDEFNRRRPLPGRPDAHPPAPEGALAARPIRLHIANQRRAEHPEALVKPSGGRAQHHEAPRVGGDAGRVLGDGGGGLAARKLDEPFTERADLAACAAGGRHLRIAETDDEFLALLSLDLVAADDGDRHPR